MSNKNETNEVVVFSDATGRVLIGQYQGVDGENTRVKSPMIINAQDRGNGQMALGCIPYTYLEVFDADSDDVWAFPTQNIVWYCGKISEQYIDLYNRVLEKYNQSRMQMKQSEDDSAVAEGGDVIDFTK